MAKAPAQAALEDKDRDIGSPDEAIKLGFKWLKQPSMPTKRVFTAPVIADGRLYVVGGCDNRGTPLNIFEVYDPAKNKWFSLPNLPTKKAGTSVAGIGKKVISFGGVSLSQQPLDEVEIYDPETKQWTEGDSLKEPVLGMTAVTRGDRAIVIGGMAKDGDPRNTIMSYDVEKNQWKMMLPMPTPRYACSAFIIKDKLYVIGGRQGKVPTQALDEYDFTTERWRKLPDIPGRRVFPAYAYSDTHIFSFGGLHEDAKDGFSDVCEFYDIEKEKWTVGSSMKHKRGDFVAGCIGGKAIVAGGLGSDGKAMSYNEIFDVEKNEWMVMPPMPTSHCSCASIILNGVFHIIGGLGQTPGRSSGPSNCMESLSIPPGQ